MMKSYGRREWKYEFMKKKKKQLRSSTQNEELVHAFLNGC